MDDIVDTAGTLCSAAAALKQQGAKTVRAYCSHPVLSGKAIENITNSDLDEIVVTNSIPLSTSARACDKVRSLSLAHMLARIIRKINEEESVSSMFPE